MGGKLDFNLLTELINDCVYISQANNPTPAQLKIFYNESVSVVNSYEKVFPAQCAKVELLWHLYKLRSITLHMAAHLMAAALTEIRNQFDVACVTADEEESPKLPKVFISHATADKEIVEKLVTMFEQIGVKRHQLFCSSIPGYGIPQGAGDLYDYIRNEMSNDDLFVVMMLSENYYNSPVCLNEMGAAWVKRSAYQSILLPGFQYSEIRGAVDPRDICFSLSDTDNRTHALNEFKNRILSHLGLTDIDHEMWERFRGKFLAEVDALATMPCSDVSIVPEIPNSFPM